MKLFIYFHSLVGGPVKGVWLYSLDRMSLIGFARRMDWVSSLVLACIENVDIAMYIVCMMLVNLVLFDVHV